MRDVVLTDRGPKPIGPYSQAVRANGFLFVSGQVALDPKTGEMSTGDVREQTERVLENVKGIVEAAGSSLGRVVKTTVFLADMNDFAAMNDVYARYFAAAPPALGATIVNSYVFAVFLSNLLVGKLAGFLGVMSGWAFWSMHAGIVAVGGVLLLLCARLFGRLLAPRSEDDR